jgi:hypothetical protein
MKHLLTTLFVVFLSFNALSAQEKTLTKEEKAAAKVKKEADLQEAFKIAGFTSNEEELVRTSYAKRSTNYKVLKADTSFSEEDVKVKAKEFSASEDDMLKEKIGIAKYKVFKATQKVQKEAAQNN